MSGISKKAVFQVIRDFWIPFLAASVWTVYSLWRQEITVKSVFSTFGPSFFLFSWLSGQLIRVRKQAGVEASFEELQQRLENIIVDFRERSLSTINHITGGDSYCFAEPNLSAPTFYTIQWLVKNAGEFPMYQVNATIDDLDSRSRFLPGPARMSSEKFSLGDVPLEATRQFEWASIRPNQNRHFTITFESRNGIVIQDVRIRWNGEQRELAYRLRRNGEESSVIKEVVPSSFPRDDSGKFDWSEPPIKVLEFTGFQSSFSQNL